MKVLQIETLLVTVLLFKKLLNFVAGSDTCNSAT
jgi:hypothetical protein